MYRIMLVKSKRDHYQSLYQWLTAVDETTGDVAPIEFDTIEALDEKIEEMLNNGIAKTDFIPVQYIDYKIEATDYNIE